APPTRRKRSRASSPCRRPPRTRCSRPSASPPPSRLPCAAMAWKEQMVPVYVNAGGLALEGIWQKGAGRGAVVAPPHPQYGGSLEHPVVSEIASGLYKAGVASLRFNWRGVGASQGRVTGEWSAAEEDFTAALEQVAATLPPPVVAAGYSF